MEVHINLNFKSFGKRAEDALDEGFVDVCTKLNEFATDTAPLRDSGLRNSTFDYPKKVGKHKWIFAFNKEYAAYQERGARADGSRVVKNYNTAGTGKGYLKKAVDRVFPKTEQILAHHVRKAGLK